MVKFLLIHVVNDRFALISFNKLLMEFERMNKDENTIYISPVYSLSNMYKSWHDVLSSVHSAYMKKDILKIKKLLFKNIPSDRVELYVDSAVIGVRSDGVQIRAVRAGEYALRFEAEIKDNIENNNKYNKLMTKLSLAGINCNIVGYDSGIMYVDESGIEYLDAKDCIYLNVQNLSIIDKVFNNICIDVSKMYGLRNVKVNCLIQSGIYELIGSQVEVNNVAYANITHINNCIIKMGNVDTLHTSDIIDSLIEIDNAYNINISGDIANSQLVFNCNFTKETLAVCRYTATECARFTFTKEVDVDALRVLIDRLKKNNRKSTFRVMLNSSEYRKCADRLDWRYMTYHLESM